MHRVRNKNKEVARLVNSKTYERKIQTNWRPQYTSSAWIKRVQIGGDLRGRQKGSLVQFNLCPVRLDETVRETQSATDQSEPK